MSIETLPVARPIKGYYPTTLTKSKKMEGLATSGNIDDEIWTALEYYSEIEETGKQYLSSRGIPKRSLEKTYKEFRAYVRQAKNYYYSAKSLHYRSSSLLYYYCFLNLVKAGLILHDPTLSGSKLTHGLSFDVKRKFSNFEQTVVKVQRGNSQIFPNFYKHYFHESLPLDVLNISKLIGYASDVEAEGKLCGLNDFKLLPCIFSAVTNEDDQTAWALLGIKHGRRYLEYVSRSTKFLAEFERVDLHKQTAHSLWGILAAPHSENLYFQQKKVHKWLSPSTPYPPYSLGQETIAALDKCFQPNLFSTEPNCFVVLPYAKNKPVVMDETMAIYVIMFYLGSLVRYKPDYIESLLDKRESWLISSFIRSAPLTFLRGIMPWVVETDYRFIPR